MLVIKVKMIPIITMYVFQSCFLQKFAAEAPIGPCHPKEEVVKQVEQPPTTLLTPTRVLVLTVFLVHGAANVYVVALTQGGLGVFSYMERGSDNPSPADATVFNQQ